MMAGDAAACDGKIGYETRSEAVAVARRMARQGSKGAKVYRCRACGAWHVGSKRWRAKRPEKPRVKWWRWVGGQHDR